MSGFRIGRFLCCFYVVAAMLVSLLLIIDTGQGLAFILIWQWLRLLHLSWRAIKSTEYHAHIQLLWWWRRQVPLDRQHTSDCTVSHVRRLVFVFGTVKTSNPTFIIKSAFVEIPTGCLPIQAWQVTATSTCLFVAFRRRMWGSELGRQQTRKEAFILSRSTNCLWITWTHIGNGKSFKNSKSSDMPSWSFCMEIVCDCSQSIGWTCTDSDKLVSLGL